MVPVDTNGDGVVDAVVPAAPGATDGSDPAAGPSSEPAAGSGGASPEEAPGAPSVTTTTRHSPAVTTTSRPVATTTSPPATTAPPVTTPPPSVGGPTAVADTVSVGTAAQKDIDVLKNDVAGTENFDKSTVTILVPPAHAANYEVRSDRKIRYRSVLLFIGVDTLTYQVCDTTGRCSVATLTIDVGLL
jgi:hypothetical protein